MDMQCNEGLRQYSKSWTLKIKDLSEIVIDQSKEYDKILRRLLQKRKIVIYTKIMPQGIDNQNTIQGIVMFEKLKDMALLGEGTYQEALGKDSYFKDLVILHRNGKMNRWLKHMLIIEHYSSINLLCQDINLELYHIMTN